MEGGMPEPSAKPRRERRLNPIASSGVIGDVLFLSLPVVKSDDSRTEEVNIGGGKT